MDIRITVNQNPHTLTEGATIGNLLTSLGYNQRVAVWVNGQQLLLADYSTKIVAEGDKIKVRRIVAGG